jgi:cytochrome P450
MIYLIAAAAAVLASLLLLLEYSWSRQRQFFKRPPGWPIIGHALLFDPAVFLSDVKAALDRYGPFMQLSVFNRTYLVTTDREVMQEALAKRPKTFRRPRLFEPPFGALGMWPHSLFVAEGSLWNRLRKATSTPFNKQNVGMMGPAIATEIGVALKRIEDSCGESVGE